jgi:hypothetical protein
MAPLTELWDRIQTFQKSADPDENTAYDHVYGSKLLCEEGAWHTGGPPVNPYGVHPTGLYDPGSRTIDTGPGRFSNWYGFAYVDQIGKYGSDNWYEQSRAAGGQEVGSKYPSMEDITFNWLEDVVVVADEFGNMDSLTVGGVKMYGGGKFIGLNPKGMDKTNQAKAERTGMGLERWSTQGGQSGWGTPSLSMDPTISWG